MKAVIKKDLLHLFSRTIEIMAQKDKTDLEELKDLSEHAIEDVAVHKDMDLVSITVLIYSIYKIFPDISDEHYKDLYLEMQRAQQQLEQNNMGRYNQEVKVLFDLVRNANAKIKVHLNDVMHAARIKKSASLLSKGLSIGQAAGIMGLSNWDLQQYIGRTVYYNEHKECTPCESRVDLAFKLFGVSRNRF
jgi:hypothetical protein